jgi:hypothetical protein
MNKKTILLIGGGIAAYLVWKKYFKKEEVIAPVDGESTSGVDGVKKVFKHDSYDNCICADGTVKNGVAAGGCYKACGGGTVKSGGFSSNKISARRRF